DDGMAEAVAAERQRRAAKKPKKSADTDWWASDSLTIPANGDIQAWAGRMQKAIAAAPTRELLMQLQADNQASIDRLAKEAEPAGRRMVQMIKARAEERAAVPEDEQADMVGAPA